MKNNCQEAFLNVLRKTKKSVTVYLYSGIKLNGKIVGFDNFALLLQRESQIQLIYKHSISTILPSETFKISQLFSDDQEEISDDENME